MSNRRRSKPDPNQLSFIDQLKALKPLVNPSVSVLATWALLTFSGSIVSRFETSPHFVVHRLEIAAAYGFLLFLAACTLAVEFKRGKDLDALPAFHAHLKIVVAGLVVAAAVWASGTVRAQVHEWQRQAQERQRQDDQRERDRLKEAEAGRIACEADRRKEIGRIEKRKAEAHSALVACTEEYERQKKSTEVPIQQRCWNEWAVFNTADGQLKGVLARRCDGTPGRK